jgi:hypothetical protein
MIELAEISIARFSKEFKGLALTAKGFSAFTLKCHYQRSQFHHHPSTMSLSQATHQLIKLSQLTLNKKIKASFLPRRADMNRKNKNTSFWLRREKQRQLTIKVHHNQRSKRRQMCIWNLLILLQIRECQCQGSHGKLMMLKLKKIPTLS